MSIEVLDISILIIQLTFFIKKEFIDRSCATILELRTYLKTSYQDDTVQ